MDRAAGDYSECLLRADASYAVDLIGDKSLSGALTCSSDAHVFVGISLLMEASETSVSPEHYDHIWWAVCFMGGISYCQVT